MPVPAFQGREIHKNRSVMSGAKVGAGVALARRGVEQVRGQRLHMGKAALMLEISLGVFWCTERDLKEEREEDRRRERARAGGVWHFVELRWSSPVRLSSLQTGAIRRFS